MKLYPENAACSLPQVQHRYITSTHNNTCKQRYRRKKDIENLAARAGLSYKVIGGAEGPGTPTYQLSGWQSWQ